MRQGVLCPLNTFPKVYFIIFYRTGKKCFQVFKLEDELFICQKFYRLPDHFRASIVNAHLPGSRLQDEIRSERDLSDRCLLKSLRRRSKNEQKVPCFIYYMSIPNLPISTHPYPLEKESSKGVHIWLCITDPLCTPEINTTLQINHTPIKKNWFTIFWWLRW